MDYKVTEKEMREASEKLNDLKRNAKYESLKKDIEEITYKSSHRRDEFQSGMQAVDTDKILKEKRVEHGFFNRALDRFTHMMSIRPITGNIMAPSS